MTKKPKRKTVFVVANRFVTESSFSFRLVGVFSTRKRAEAYIARREKFYPHPKYNDSSTIDEYVITEEYFNWSEE